MADRRVLMVALDALDGGLLARLLESGRLPHLAAFAGQHERLAVRSDGETLHGSVWPTFASGTGPGTHGVYFWNQWRAEQQGYVRNNHPDFAYEPFWAALAPAGAAATIVDVPYVPALRAPGIRTAIGWGLHDEVKPASEPAGFLRAIRRRYGRHPLQMDTVEPLTAAEKARMVDSLRRGVEMRARLLTDLAGQQRWRLLVATFSEFHKASHYLSSPEELAPGLSNEEGMLRILEAFDAAWPRMVAAAGAEADVYLFALHGTREQADYSALGRQVLVRALGRETEPPAAGGPDVLRRVRDLIPGPLHRALWAALPPAVRARRTAALALRGVDVRRDPLFPVIHDGHLAVRLNLAGRERAGFVPAGEGEALLVQLEEAAGPFLADGGQRAFAGRWRVAEHVHGPRVHRLPDALLLANPEVRRTAAITHPDGTRFILDQAEARNGVHTSEGFCYTAFAGGGCATRDTVDARDFAPTVLGRLGIATPGRLEGRSFAR